MAERGATRRVRVIAWRDFRYTVLTKGFLIGAIILPGVSIGRNSVIGAGAIVTKDIPPFSVAVGNPARVIKTIAKLSIDNAC